MLVVRHIVSPMSTFAKLKLNSCIARQMAIVATNTNTGPVAKHTWLMSCMRARTASHHITSNQSITTQPNFCKVESSCRSFDMAEANTPPELYLAASRRPAWSKIVTADHSSTVITQNRHTPGHTTLCITMIMK